MCHLFVQKCFKLLMKHSSQADDKVNIYIENCLSCDQNQMHIILCSLSACYFLSKFLRVTFYVRVCWLLQLQQVHMKLLCRYFDNPSQFIFNQSDTMDHKTSKQCPAPAPVPLLPPAPLISQQILTHIRLLPFVSLRFVSENINIIVHSVKCL